MTRTRTAARTATVADLVPLPALPALPALLALLVSGVLGGCSDAPVEATTTPSTTAGTSAAVPPTSGPGTTSPAPPASGSGAASPVPATKGTGAAPTLPAATGSTTTTRAVPTGPAATQPASTKATAALPPAAVPQHGQTYWAVVVAVAPDPAAPVLLDAERRLARLGYPRPNRAEVDCLQGAREALGLPDTSSYEVDVLFTSRAAAEGLAAAYPGGVIGVVRVTAYCLD